MRGTKDCPHCDGTGRVLNEKAVGALMREVRELKGVSQREIARRLKWSAPYVCDLEKGKALWTTRKQNKYLAALK
jgi:transcriptional regulator with XRE-family HTH domain